LFDTREDGYDLKTFFNSSIDSSTIIIIKTTDDETFGAFVTKKWEQRENFYGDGQCFLFQLDPYLNLRWTKKNEFFMFSNSIFFFFNKDCIAMGSGGYYGFYVDGDLRYGTSQVSETYGGNKGLTKNEDFKVYAIQLFGFEVFE
jgi:hypothetical protein